MSEILTRYVRAFSTLHRNQNPRFGSAPHKPILLLAILDGIGRGEIRTNNVSLTPALVAAFRLYWRTLIPENTWTEKVVYPFRYLVHEKFWTLLKDGRIVPASELGHPTSIGQFSEVVDSGRFSDDLWDLLQDNIARDILRNTLRDTYFAGVAPHASEADVADPLEDELKRLIAEAKRARFRKTPIPKSVQESDAGYLRHYLFRDAITRLYEHRCAVCQTGIYDESERSLVDAAHIMSFAKFGNDDPRNGLALCPNHHRGFDAGWFGLSNDHRLIVSPRVLGSVASYVKVGARITLPKLNEYVPAREAIEWHRKNILQS